MNTTRGSIGRLLVVILAGLVLAGCRTPGPAASRVDVQLGDEETYRQFWLHAISSVRHFGYDLDRADPAAGVITSRPLTSKQWFEFWRNDTLAAGQVFEASLHTIRRQIRLTVQPTPNKEEYLVSAVVDVERQERAERQVTTPANVMQAFNPKSTLTADSADGRSVLWVNLGRDPVLEAALLKQVARWPGAKVVLATDETDPVAVQPAEPLPTAEPEPAAE
jgi:hypothetical protein